MKPLCIDLFCGLGGWAEGFLVEGYDVIGFDVERHRYPKRAIDSSSIKAGGIDFKRHDSFNGTTEKRLRQAPVIGGEWDEYPGQLVLQDVLTLHGSQFKDAAVIVASPPCQAYSYRAMPWKRARALPPPDNTLFQACFRIQREASEAAGQYIPLVIENVKGAQPWVGRARWHHGSFYLWGDVPALMPPIRSIKNSGGCWFNIGSPGQTETSRNPVHEAAKGARAAWFNDHKQNGTAIATEDRLSYTSSRSSARKAASAQIAKIPFPLANHIARVYKP